MKRYIGFKLRLREERRGMGGYDEKGWSEVKEWKRGDGRG